MSKLRLRILAAGWLALVSTGMVLLAAYKGTPGVVAPSPRHWPVGTTLSHDPAQPTLVLFLHPQCPCSRATIGELEMLMAQLHDPLRVQVAFIQPPGTSDDWVETDLWSTAARIPGVSVLRDREGIEAARFQVQTSGEALLYSAGGELLYEGGITIARGHAGENPGRSSIAALVQGQRPPTHRRPVFGCPMFEGPALGKFLGEPTCKK